MALSYRIRIFLIQVLFLFILDEVLPDRTSLKIYQPLQAEFYCFRRLNGTHEFGCSSDRRGNVGVIHVVSSEDDVQFILDDDSGVKYIAALRADFFNMGNMTKLQDSGRVTGVIVLRSSLDLPEQGFSPDSTCPNDGSVRYCDPLTDRNVISTLYATSSEKPVTNRSVVIVGARMDTFSMFDSIAPGADSSVSGFITLLIAAQMLNQLKVAQKPEFVKNNVLFVLFNGEAFDYIGSSRVVYDMETGQFPLANPPSPGKVQPASLALKHISHFVELSQVAPLGNLSTVYLHTDPVSTDYPDVNQTVNNLIEQIKKAATAKPLKLTVETSASEQPLPPSSVQRFLKEDKEIASVVITNHDRQFQNRYYNSFLDNWQNLNSTGSDLQGVAEHLTKLAAAVASAVFKVVTGEDAKGLALDKFREVSVLVGGITVFLVSLLTVHCLNQQAVVLFTPRALVGI
ncbi:hypothetical protein V5799_020459 [Amblyomma americanum]|uniref:Nicastrin n=1 Tax=Amblyomma americanum TaxID=6943 RepID=A0AAQ4ETY6_AMBAM